MTEWIASWLALYVPADQLLPSASHRSAGDLTSIAIVAVRGPLLPAGPRRKLTR